MERNEPAPCVNEGLQVQRFDDFFHRFRRFVQLGELLRVEWCGHFVLDAAAAHDGGHGKHHVVQPIFAILVIRYGNDGLLIARNGLANTLHRHRDAVIRRMLFLDDFVCGVLYIFRDAFHGRFMVVMAAKLAEIVDRNARDVRGRPYGDLGIAVLAHDARMHVARVDAQVLAEDVFEARRVEHGC